MKFQLSDTLVLFVSLFLLAAKSPAFEPPSPVPLPNFDKRTDGLQAGDVVSGNQGAVITGFSPASGIIGTSVTISGTNFSPVAANNIVYFGAVQAVVTAASVTNLVATVPAGATYAPITETVGGLVAYANTAFEPTFPGDGSDIGPSSFTPRVDLAGGSGSYLTIIADLDGDGKPDLVVANCYDQNLSLFRNISTNGTLNVNSFAPRVDLPSIGGAPGGLAVADVDGDGKLDLVVSDSSNNRVMVYRNISTVGTLTTNSFAVPVAFSVGNSPVAVRVRDLDDDGRPDIACVCSGENTISILRNIGMAGDLTTNSFAPRVVLATGNNPHDLVIADLDGDGKPDLAQVNYTSSFLSVFRNVSVQGVIDTNSFAARVDFAASGEGDSITAGDVDGDGKVDLVVGCAIGSAVAVYRNLASPGSLDTNSLASEVDFSAPGWVRGVAMGDLNGDGKPDISLTCEVDSFMCIYQNVSTPGSFTNTSLASRVDYGAGWNPHGVAIGDLDGDGRPDIIFGNQYDSTISIYRNVMPFGGAPIITAQPTNQTVTVGNPANFNVTASGTPPLSYQWNFNGTNIAGATNTSLILTDVQLNHAGNYAVLVTNAYGSALSSNAVLTVNPPLSDVPVITGFNPISGVVGTAVTIFGTNFSPVASNNIVYFGAVQATVIAASATNLVVTVPVGATYAPITVTVNGLTAYANQPFMPTFFGDGSGITVNSFAPRLDLPVGSGPIRVIIADLDGDGKPDLIVANDYNNSISLYRNISTNGSLTAGSFAPRVDLVTPSGSYSPFGLVVADVDGDGKLDIVVSDYDESIVSVYRNTCTPGNISSNSFATRVDFATGAQPQGVEVRDIDGDGRPDLLVANTGDGTVSILRNTGVMGNLTTNSFAPKVDIATGSGCDSVAAGDLDGDGKPDVVTVNSGNDTVSLLRNISTPGSITTNSFAAKVDIAVLSGPIQVAIGDLDGDGKPDLTVTFYFPQTVSVLRNTSTVGSLTTNSFAPRIDYSLGGRGHTPAIADLDGDGKPDVAVVTELDSLLSIFRNVSTPGSFTNSSLAGRVDYATGWNAWGISVGDLDGDGRPDVVFGNCYDNTISIYQNATPFGGPPVITAQPTNQMITVGGTATFSVTVGGTPPLSYQWNFNGTNILGATNTTLTLTNVQVSQAGNYTVLVTNVLGSITSSNAVLTVLVPTLPPTILAQPTNQTVPVNGTATFSVTADGTGPLSYFWRRSGVPIPGANGTNYTLNNVQLSDSGSQFSCLVSNAYGTALSSNAVLKVIETVANDLCGGAIIISSAAYTNAQSTTKATSIGDPVPDCVTGFGNGVWYQFTPPSSGLMIVDTFGSDFDTGLAVYTGTCDALTETACNDDTDGVTSQVIIPATAGTTYSILVGGYSAHAGNLVFHLTYLTPPAFVVQPTNQSVVVSSNASFSTTVSGTQPISFQWYFNNAPLVDGGRISGSTNTTLNIASIQTNDAGNYQLVASNMVGVTTSSVAILTPIILPPVITQQPVDQSAFVGSNATFTAVVDGTPPFSYQWYFNGSALSDDARISGSAMASLSISNITMADAGSYALTVTNVSGSTNSTAAMLTVLVPPSITIQPIGRSVPPGLPTTFTAAASGNPAPTYQWQLNGTNIPGATSSSYTITAVGTNDLGFYHLVASNAVNVAVSADAQLTFGPVAAWGRNLSNESLPPPGLSNVFAVAGTIDASFAVRTDGSIAAWGSGAATNIPTGATNVVAITSPGNTTANYALRSDGTVVGWNGISAPALSNIVSVAAGINFGCALRAEGTLTNWGIVPTPGFPAGLNHLTAIAAGNINALALRNDGTVVASGFGAVTNVPSGLSNVVAIAAGYTYAMALKADGTVVAWGSGTVTNLPAGMTNIIAISACNAENLVLAIRANGMVVAWGNNTFGEANPPAILSNLVSVAVAATIFHGLALVNDGSPVILHPPIGLTAYTGRDVTLHGDAAGAQPLNYQWLLSGTNIPGATNTSLVISNVQSGNAGNYQLFVSNAVNTALSLPAPLTVISNNALVFLSVPASQTNYQGSKVSLGVTVLGNGPLRYQWFFSVTNKNYAAILDATNDTLVLDPALVVNTGNYCVAVSNQFAGITNTPVYVRVLFARAWGFQAVSNPPVNVTNAIAIATGGYQNYYGHYFALGSDGKLTSWANYYASYGETNVSALSNSTVIAIAAGSQSSLALRSDGTVYAWGYGYYGQTNPPSGLNNVVAIACGDYHDLALKSDGTVIAWGQNLYGEGTNSLVATNAAVAIAAGTSHNLGLRADGTVFGWGYNSYGQTTIPFNATNVIAIAAGQYHSLALRANGTVVGWGNNGNGQVSIPAGLSNIVAISASGSHSTMLRADGTVLSLGYEYTGYASNAVPSDLANVIAISSGGDHDFGLLGTRAPAITVQPWNRTIFNTTTSVWFAAKVAGVQPVSYQWQLNGTNLPAATNDTVTVTSFVLGKTNLPIQSGTYRLIASNAYGAVTSKPAKLTVAIPLGNALDATNLTWSTSGSAQWFGETSVTHDGVDAARSGAIGALQETILQTTVATNWPGSYNFWWKVSSEQYFDILEFRVNGIVQTNISGEVDWQQVSIPVAAGTNILQWRYSKDASFDAGQDAGWVDQFTFLPGPVIISQPVSRTNYAGTTAIFNVTATSIGQTQFGYQWRKNGFNLANGGNVSGATTFTLALNNVQDADAASYTCIITNSGGSVTSSPAMLTVLDSPPVIISSPVSRTNLAGTTATFSVTAVGAVPLSYQWQKNGSNLMDGGNVSGSTMTALVLTNVLGADATAYTVVITNVFGSVTSSPAMLTVVGTAPTIASQPSSCTNFAGTTATFSVAASGITPFSYQWQFNGTNLDGATNLLLTLNNVRRTNAGPYQVVVTNAWGSVTSSIATLTVVRSRVVAWGNNDYGQTNVPPGLTDLTAIASGFGHSLALQANGTVVGWGYNGDGETKVPAGLSNVVAIASGFDHNLALQANGAVVAWGYNYGGQTNVPSGLANVVALAGGGDHSLALQTNGIVVAWGLNNCGQTNVPSGLTNAVAIAGGYLHSLALKMDGTIVAWGFDSQGETDVPQGLTNVVAIAGKYLHNLALKANGTVIAWGDNSSGQTNVPPGLTNVAAIATGSYHSLALKANGTIVAWGDSSNGQTNVPPDLTNVVALAGGGYYSLAIQNDGSPFIVRQTGNQTVSSNTTVIFNVTALGQSALNYQWQKNGINLTDGGNVSGSATASLMLTNVQNVDMAAYTIVITNAIDSITSSPAMLMVVSPPAIMVQPVSQTVRMGTNMQFRVMAVGYPPPAYQWWWNGTNPVGVNSSTLTLTGVCRAHNGVYSVVVTNAEGGAASSNAVLKVLVPQKLGAPVLLPDGSLLLNSGDADGGLLSPSDLANFEAQASTNLVDWVTLTNALSLTNGMLQLQDNSGTNWPARFCRLIEH